MVRRMYKCKRPPLTDDQVTRVPYPLWFSVFAKGGLSSLLHSSPVGLPFRACEGGPFVLLYLSGDPLGRLTCNAFNSQSLWERKFFCVNSRFRQKKRAYFP